MKRRGSFWVSQGPAVVERLEPGSDQVEEMMHLMERHSKLQPEDRFGKSMVPGGRLILAAGILSGAGDPTI